MSEHFPVQGENLAPTDREPRVRVRFRTLGTLDLTDSSGREIGPLLRSPKLLALLSYLAIARPNGFHRRDTLVALLWPELDHAHARNALRQAVHSLRDALGQAVLVGRGEEELGIDGERLWCDVRQLEAALERGEFEPALELYHGELLSGLHVPEVPEFERWVDGEREHVRRRAAEAARVLTDREDAAGNPAGAARWARRLSELSPSDETVAQRLIQLLNRAGDRAGAVRAYQEFERRLARDLELEPSTGTRAAVAAVRARPPAEEVARPITTEGATAGDSSTADLPGPREPGRVPAVRRGWIGRNRIAAGLAVAGSLLTSSWFAAGGSLSARSGATSGAATRLVVLPFANLGPADEAYFTAGITEELTARLAVVNRLRVIGTTSANQYKDTTKPIPEIGKELGVDYVLEGSVRWQKTPGGVTRVRVTPQLVSTKDGIHLWAQVYEEPVDEIFRVQTDIAEKVVQALDVTLEPQRLSLKAGRTANLEAYSYFIRGNEYRRRGAEERLMRATLEMYQKAVELDSGFALAYARISLAHSRMYLFHYDRSDTRLAMAKQALDRAFQLEPDLPEAHHALGTYYWIGYLDYDRALREFAIAEESRPNDSELLIARAVLRTRQGKPRESLADFLKARELDPGSTGVESNYGQAYEFLRDFPRAEAHYNRALALAPDQTAPYFWKSGLYLRWQGDTRKAQAVLDEAARVGVPSLAPNRVMVDIFARRYADALRRLSSEAPEVINGQVQFTPKALLYAQVYGLMQRHHPERAYYDTARVLMTRKLKEQPDDPRLHSALGIAYAGLGLKQEAIQEGRRAVELLPVSKEAYRGYSREWDLARIYVMVGDQDSAIERLEHLLSIPGLLTTAWLRIDPVWDPLRSHPRFRRLMQSGA